MRNAVILRKIQPTWMVKKIQHLINDYVLQQNFEESYPNCLHK